MSIRIEDYMKKHPLNEVHERMRLLKELQAKYPGCQCAVLGPKGHYSFMVYTLSLESNRMLCFVNPWRRGLRIDLLVNYRLKNNV